MLAAGYRAAGWWSDDTVGDLVGIMARKRPEATAFVADGRQFDYRSYDRASDRLASILTAAGLSPGQRIAVLLPDGATAHAAYLANEKAGLTTVGLGSRAAALEMGSIIDRTGASALVTQTTHRGRTPAPYTPTSVAGAHRSAVTSSFRRSSGTSRATSSSTAGARRGQASRGVGGSVPTTCL